MSIENKINDSINPNPDFELSINDKEKTVQLKVKAGFNKPYTYKSKAYKRNDTSTIEVDKLELSRLILEGKNTNYEEVQSNKKTLSFDILSKYLNNELKIKNTNIDILKTFNLIDNSKRYNHAAELLSDKNFFPGIDIARFGESINIVLSRKMFTNQSIILELENAIEIYKDYYVREEISGVTRNSIELIPETAFREAIANALIHRTWDINSDIKVYMFDDRIEIISPGGLPYGISVEEYLNGGVSILRNPILTNKVVLPTISNIDLTDDENIVYNLLSKTSPKSMGDILKNVPFGKSKTTSILKKLHNDNYICVEGNGRGTKYKLI